MRGQVIPDGRWACAGLATNGLLDPLKYVGQDACIGNRVVSGVLEVYTSWREQRGVLEISPI